ncbi:MAG: hypothetical protein IKA05_04675 [Clostridia bacterium]|nr:hypothetical protein [Clostridia bacterium]
MKEVFPPPHPLPFKNFAHFFAKSLAFVHVSLFSAKKSTGLPQCHSVKKTKPPTLGEVERTLCPEGLSSSVSRQAAATFPAGEGKRTPHFTFFSDYAFSDDRWTFARLSC